MTKTNPPSETAIINYRHFCPDWDYMEIDETSPEFACCTCFYLIETKTREKERREALRVLAMFNSIRSIV
jgi:hypothetical protein